MAITYRTTSTIDVEPLLSLYRSVGWSTYTGEPATLQASVSASLRVVSAWDGERLVDLARIVGDGLTIVYLQDILVTPTHHRRGIGRELLRRVLKPYSKVRQQVLLTDNDPEQQAFYEAMGFAQLAAIDSSLRAYARFT